MLQRIVKECLAGLAVAVVALPLALAFGITATGSPEGAIVGLYGAIFAGFFAAIFGGTPAQVTGPTGPITVVATTTIAAHGLQHALLAFMLAGFFQILFGVSRLGAYIRYVPYPVVSGFMGGIALIIILGELDQVHAGFLIVAATIVLMLVSGRLIPMVPASLIALIVITVALLWAGPALDGVIVPLPGGYSLPLNLRVDYIGQIPQGLPSIHIPDFSGSLLLQLLLPALAIALLGSIDSLLTSVVMDGITGKRHNSNKELIGQGIGNVASGLFGGLASAGATVRSVVNVRSGGRTALSAAVHSVVLLLLAVAFGFAVQYIPLAVLAGILILTAIGMFDWESLRIAHISPRGDVLVMFTTMAVTVLVDLTVAVGVGVLLSLLIHFPRARPHKARVVDDGGTVTIHGPLSFLSADKVFATLREADTARGDGDEIVLSLDGISYLDTSGARALLHYVEHSDKTGISLRLHRAPDSIDRRLMTLANNVQRTRLHELTESRAERPAAHKDDSGDV